MLKADTKLIKLKFLVYSHPCLYVSSTYLEIKLKEKCIILNASRLYITLTVLCKKTYTKVKANINCN